MYAGTLPGIKTRQPDLGRDRSPNVGCRSGYVAGLKHCTASVSGHVQTKSAERVVFLGRKAAIGA